MRENIKMLRHLEFTGGYLSGVITYPAEEIRNLLFNFFHRPGLDELIKVVVGLLALVNVVVGLLALVSEVVGLLSFKNCTVSILASLKVRMNDA
jgi:hypothetical protein